MAVRNKVISNGVLTCRAIELAIGQSYCPSCGVSVQQHTAFCANCGTKITPPLPHLQQAPPSHQPSGPVQAPVSTGPYKAVIGILLVVIVILGALAFGHVLTGNRYSLSNPPSAQSIQPYPVPATLPSSAKTIWNACGNKIGRAHV